MNNFFFMITLIKLRISLYCIYSLTFKLFNFYWTSFLSLFCFHKFFLCVTKFRLINFADAFSSSVYSIAVYHNFTKGAYVLFIQATTYLLWQGNLLFWNSNYNFPNQQDLFLFNFMFSDFKSWNSQFYWKKSWIEVNCY
jgi:hypothetical protein